MNNLSRRRPFFITYSLFFVFLVSIFVFHLKQTCCQGHNGPAPSDAGTDLSSLYQ